MEKKIEFTYQAYQALLNLIKENGYQYSNYNDYSTKKKVVILRHDIDYYLEYALRFAEIENENGAQAVYFVEISSEFYNVFSKRNTKIAQDILDLGHVIGLHFDRTKYGTNFDVTNPEYRKRICEQLDILEQAIGKKIRCLSMHEPSKDELIYDLQLKNVKNAYSKEFFEGFKYYSDSVMNWREDVVGGICSGAYDRIQILTHPFWYAQEEGDIKTMLKRFINSGNVQRYTVLEEICCYFDQYITEKDLITER